MPRAHDRAARPRPLLRASCLLIAGAFAACGSTPVEPGAAPRPEPGPAGVVGIGVVLGMDHEGTEFAMPFVADLRLDGPAAAAGVGRRDTIWTLAGRDTKGLSRAAVEAMLQGPRGTTLQLRVGRSRGMARDVVVTRAALPANSLRCESGDCQDGTGEAVDMWGERYAGEFKGGAFHGKGKLTRSDGEVHEGRFAQGVLDGPGEVTRRNGDRFTGMFERGEPRTLKIVLSNGDFYEGETKGFTMHGQGRLQRPGDGDVWEGRFEDGKLVEGTWLHHPPRGEGRTCERAIRAGLLARGGTIVFPAGDPKKRVRYEGGLDPTCRASGEGVMRYADKKKGMAGAWLDDEPQGALRPVE